MSRYARRTDDNHATIVEALRKVGCLVQSLAAAGGGVPDLLVLRAGKLFLIEIKDGRKEPARRKLTPDQTRWRSAGWPVHVALCAEDALRAVGLVDMRARVERNAASTERTIAAALVAFHGEP